MGILLSRDGEVTSQNLRLKDRDLFSRTKSQFQSLTRNLVLNVPILFFQPGCIYRVRVKTGDSNPHIERASPSFIDIQVMAVCTAYR